LFATKSKSLDDDVISEIVRAGLLAPSGENTQPWTFAWNRPVFTIHYDRARAGSPLNANHSASLISLGAVLANLEIAASERGYRLEKTSTPAVTGGSPNQVAAIRFISDVPRPHPLSQAIAERCTNRRPYAAIDLLQSEIGQLEQAVAAVPNARLDFVSERPAIGRLASILARFDEIYFLNRRMHDDLYKWLRWSKKDADEKKDGLSVASLEMNIFDRWGVKLAASWRFARFLGKSRLSAFIVKRAERQYRASGAYGIITMPGSSPDNFVQGGESFQKMWLTATRLGLSLQPISGLMFLLLRKRLGLTSEPEPENRDHYQKSVDELASFFPVLHARTPVMIFRIGKAEAPSDRAMRRGLDEVFRFGNGGRVSDRANRKQTGDDYRFIHF
jgi:nitroreductase